MEHSVAQVMSSMYTFLAICYNAVCNTTAKIMSWIPLMAMLPPLSIWFGTMTPAPESGDAPPSGVGEVLLDFSSERSIWKILQTVGPTTLSQWAFLIAYDPIFYLATCLFLATFTTGLLRRIILIHRMNGGRSTIYRDSGINEAMP